MVKRLELDIKCCEECPFMRRDYDYGYCCYHFNGPDIINCDAAKYIDENCPLKDKEDKIK